MSSSPGFRVSIQIGTVSRYWIFVEGSAETPWTLLLTVMVIEEHRVGKYSAINLNSVCFFVSRRRRRRWRAVE